MDEKQTLLRYLRGLREAIVWKLDGLDERAVRLPMTPTGTNLLGLVKHLAGIEIGYFGTTFGRAWPTPQEAPWAVSEEFEDNVDMWATKDESRAWVLDFYARAIAFADETIESLDLDATGRVPWWGDDDVTLHRILVHVVDETARHAGHADIVRELIDGRAGLSESWSNLPGRDAAWWRDYHATLQATADSFAGAT